MKYIWCLAIVILMNGNASAQDGSVTVACQAKPADCIDAKGALEKIGLSSAIDSLLSSDDWKSHDIVIVDQKWSLGVTAGHPVVIGKNSPDQMPDFCTKHGCLKVLDGSYLAYNPGGNGAQNAWTKIESTAKPYQ